MMYHRQRFPLWPVWGNGLGKFFFLEVTLISGQVEWFTSSGIHSFEVHNCEQFRRMVCFGGWCRTIISIRKWSGQSFPREDSFSPGFTLISAGGMAQLGEWSRFNNQGHELPRENSFSPGFTLISAEGMVQAHKSGTIILLCLRRIVQIAHG
jgi:hypothetical protein